MVLNKELEEYINSHKGAKRFFIKLWLRMNTPLVNKIVDLQKELEKVRDYEKLVENVRNINVQLEGYKQLVENVRNTNVQLEGYEQLVENVRNTNVQLEGYEQLVENVRNTNVQLEGYEQLVENVRNTNAQLEGYEQVVTNLRNNNEELEKITTLLDMHGVKISRVEKIINSSVPEPHIQNERAVEMSSKIQQSNDAYGEIDYFDFENYFRGSRAQIKNSQKQYIKYFQNRKNVIDLGCGRGEFLELLKENGIEGYGVDLYQEFVDLCVSKGLKAVHMDAISAVANEKQLGGIFAAQLIEHLSLSQIMKLAEYAYEKLEKGAYMILETPNPTSLAIYTHAFYMDPSHNKPVHPLTMKYILEKAGFTDIDIVFTECSKLPVEIPELTMNDQGNLDEFNKAMKEVEKTIFGSQDYAIIARK